MTEGEKRRSQIIKILKDSKSPVSGTKLAKVLKVSRQVIVQDMALLRGERKKTSNRLSIRSLKTT